MAACGSLHHQIFDNPNPATLIDSLSSIDQCHRHSSFTEIFGELHFKEPPDSSASHLLDPTPKPKPEPQQEPSKSIDSHPGFRGTLAAMNSDSLQLCTEGLGFESSDDIDQDLIPDHASVDLASKQHPHQKPAVAPENRGCLGGGGIEFRRSKSLGSGDRARFPPPISCVGRSGKAGVSFRSFRQGGRFVLKEIRVPAQESLRADRENGRLRLRFIQPVLGEFFNEDEDDDGDEEADGRIGDESDRECLEPSN